MNTIGYPAAVLTVRPNPLQNPSDSGRPPAPVAEVWPPGGLQVTGDFAIFIHGFNNSYTEARASYAFMRANLLAQGYAFAANVLEFHWPGDAPLLWSPVLGYPTDITPALESGARLADWIVAHSTDRFWLVSHSLGARVVVGAIQALRQNGGLGRIAGICMMAPAVPVHEIDPAEFGPLPSDSFNWTVLYSTGDLVLRWAFPPGEMADAQGILPEAVGLNGNPAGVWNVLFAPCFSSANTRYDHGNYWPSGPELQAPDDGIARSPTPFVPQFPGVVQTVTPFQAATQVAKALGASVPNQIASGPIANRAPPPPAATIASNVIASHQLPSYV